MDGSASFSRGFMGRLGQMLSSTLYFNIYAGIIQPAQQLQIMGPHGIIPLFRNAERLFGMGTARAGIRKD
jgi:hypothetical protein